MRPYQKALDFITQQIANGDFEYGQQLLPERELAQLVGVSRSTIRKAIEHLVQSNVLLHKPYVGTFIAEQAILRPLNQSINNGLGKIAQENRIKASSALLIFEIIKLDKVSASRFKLPFNDEAYRIKRLWKMEHRPFCLETSVIPRSLAPNLTAEQLVEHSLYELLREQYEISIAYDEAMVSLQSATKEDIEYLDLARASQDKSVLVYDGLIFDVKGRPIEWVVSKNHPDRVKFQISQGNWQKSLVEK